MPSGEYHTAATVTAAGAAALVSLSVAPDAGSWVFASVPGVLAGLLLTPDLDLIEIGGGNRNAQRFMGPLFFLWRLFWWPYGELCAHRSFLSHAPLLSTLLRLLYLLLPALLLLHWAKMLSWITAWVLEHPRSCAAWLLGLVVSDTLHWVMDVTSTKIKRMLNR